MIVIVQIYTLHDTMLQLHTVYGLAQSKIQRNLQIFEKKKRFSLSIILNNIILILILI